jgi:hypothetical protein
LNPCNALFLVLATLSCVTPARGPGAEGGKHAGYELREGRIFRSAECPAGEVAVDGSVTHVYGAGDELYYLLGRGAADKLCYAGYRNTRTGVKSEALLFRSLQGKSVRRFLGRDGAVFVLLCAGDSSNAPCVLHRVELNSMKEKRIEEVRDIALFRGKPVLLAGAGGSMKVNSNGVIVPITIGGGARFGPLLGDRFITVSNGTDTEMLDLSAMKNIYAWPASGRFAAAEDHNLLVESIDAGGAPSEEMLFYKVFVNGAYAGRTTTGPAQQARRCSLKIADNEYHVIKMERWELHAGQEKYLRANNIKQPRPMRIYMPSNRLLKLAVTREGGKYRTVRVAVKEDDK